MATSSFAAVYGACTARRAARSLDGSVDDVDRIHPHHRVEEGRWRSGPAVGILLHHGADEIHLLRRCHRRKAGHLRLLRRGIERLESGAVEIDERRRHVHRPRHQQGLAGRHAELVIDVIGDPCLFGAWQQHVAQGFERFLFGVGEDGERNIVGPRLTRAQHDSDAVEREDEPAQRGALQDDSAFEFHASSRKFLGVPGGAQSKPI